MFVICRVGCKPDLKIYPKKFTGIYFILSKCINTVNTLINKYLPVFTYKESHSILVNVNSKKAFETTQDIDMSGSFISKILMRLRGLPVEDLRMMEFLQNMNFTYLDEVKFKEFLIGC